MARSTSRCASASASCSAATAALTMRLPGERLSTACVMAGRNTISPRSDNDRRQVREPVAGSNPGGESISRCSACRCSAAAVASRSAAGVHNSPPGLGTNSASSKWRRRRASALLAAGWLSASDLPAAVTERVRCSAISSRSRFRSSWRNGLGITQMNVAHSSDPLDG